MTISTFSTATFSMAFPTAVEIVCAQSKPIKGAQQGPYPLITEAQLRQTYLNPNNRFLQDEIARIGVPLLRLSREYFTRRNELLSLLQICEEALMQVHEKIQNEKIDAAEGKKTEKRLKLENEKIQDSLRTLHNVVDPTIKSLRDEFDNLLIKHNQDWRDFEIEYTEKLIQELEQRQLILEAAKHELRRHDILPVVLDRYKDLNLTLPVQLDENEN